MESIFGPKLELDQPSEAERDWIFEAMQRPEIYVPLSCPQPPTRDLFEANRLFTREKEGDEELDVRCELLHLRLVVLEALREPIAEVLENLRHDLLQGVLIAAELRHGLAPSCLEFARRRQRS